MRCAILFAVAAGAMGQSLDLGDITGAPIASGPAVTAISQSITYSPAASGSAAVTGVETASATTSQVATANQKRDMCRWIGWGCSSSTSVKATSTSAKTSSTLVTAPKTSSTSAVQNSSTASSTTSYNNALPTPTGIPTTCSNTWTNTNTFTSLAGCPTPVEVGTYCGFVNPEDPCAAQPDGSGPVTSPDTSAALLASPALKADPLLAGTPKGYAETFSDLDAATSAASYLGLSTLTSYNVSGCAALCDSTSTCTSFNIYAERDPSLNPSIEYCCPNPASITNFKCTLWGSVIDNTTTTNAGQARESFQVVITASNGYTKTKTTTPANPAGGWGNPQ